MKRMKISCKKFLCKKIKDLFCYLGKEILSLCFIQQEQTKFGLVNGRIWYDVFQAETNGIRR